MKGARSSSAHHDEDISSVARDRRDCFMAAAGLAPVN